MKKIILTALSSTLLMASATAMASDHGSCKDGDKSPSFDFVSVSYIDSGSSDRVEALGLELSAKLAGNVFGRMSYSDFSDGSALGFDVLYAHKESDTTTLYAGVGVQTVNVEGLSGEANAKYFVGVRKSLGYKWEAGVETVLQKGYGDAYLSFDGEVKYQVRKNWTLNAGYSMAERTELDRWSVGVSYHF